MREKITWLFLCLFLISSTSIFATKFYVDLLHGNDSNTGNDWNNAKLTIASAATLGVSWDSILVKGNTWSTNSTFSFPASRKFFGSCAGTETYPSQRPLSDIDENGVIELWEFTYPTTMTSTSTGNAFIYPNSGITVDGFTFTQTQNTLTMNTRTLTLGYSTNVLVNSTIKNCNLTATVSASPFAIVLSCNGSVSNCLIEKNNVYVATSGGTDCNIQPIIGVSGGVFSNNIVRNNNVNLDFSSGTSTLSNTRGLIIMITPSTTQNTSVVSNSVIHNNEIYFKGNSNTILTNGAVVAMHNSPASSYTYLYNCTIANNKATAYSGHTATCWALRVIYTGTNTIAHNVSNNVFWNNTGTAGASGASTSGTQSGYGILNNNTGNGGTILNNSSPNSNNLNDLAITNTGTKAPYFNTPTTIAGYLSNGTVEKSIWSINNYSSYLTTKGTAIATLTTDKAGNTYSASPARAAGAYELVTAFQSNVTGNWSTPSSWQSTRDNSTWVTANSNPSSNACPVNILNGHTITITANATASSLNLNSGANLTQNLGSTFNVNGNLSINSDATNGTGTFVDKGTTTVTGTTTVNQYLSSSATGITGRNWYISSPLSAALSNTITDATGNGLVYYDGTANWPAAGTTMEVMKGYIAKSPAQNTTITFTGGTLNSGNKSVSNLPVGFNLVGNPYPSYLNWTDATKSNISTSIWYRSKSTGSYLFQTYNVAGAGIGVNGGTNIIPPMQSFWIKTTNATNTLGFTNDMRSHQDQTVLTNRLKAPKANTQKIIRLKVSNDLYSDETAIYLDENAQNDFDIYDSQKMFNNVAEAPEIYTEVGTEKLAINGLKSFPINTEIPVGFSTAQANNFSLTASELTNQDASTTIVLIDRQTNTETVLQEGISYFFSAEATNASTERFSLIFKTPGTTTGMADSEEINARVFVNSSGMITISSSEKAKYAVFNTLGQKLIEGELTSGQTYVTAGFLKGICFVKLIVNGKESTTKLIIK